MAQVTIELNTLLKVNNFKLFDFDYPYFDTVWKNQFEKQFVEFFRFHEIGSETPDLFKQRLESRLNLELPDILLNLRTLKEVTNPLILEKITKIYREGEDKLKNETNSNSYQASSNNQADFVTTDYPQHSDITEDIATQKDRNNQTGTTEGSDNMAKNSTDSKNVEGFEEITKTGGLKEIQDYMKLQGNTIKKTIEICKSLFVLIY